MNLSDVFEDLPQYPIPDHLLQYQPEIVVPGQVMYKVPVLVYNKVRATRQSQAQPWSSHRLGHRSTKTTTE